MDFGQARIGVAFSPGDALVTVPLPHVKAHPRTRAVKEIVRLVQDRGVTEVVVGLPTHLSGAEGNAAEKARSFASILASKLPEVRVCLVDERRSTIAAKGILHAQGISERHQRPLVDSVAAQVILEQALEIELASGLPPGEEVSVTPNGRSGNE